MSKQIHPTTSVSDVTHYLSSWNSEIWNDLIEVINLGRRNNPYKKELDFNSMWEEQCGINYPMMYVASVYLYLYYQQRECDTILFATRDCCHWVKIFKKLFPEVNAHYFHCSRNMLEKAGTEHNPHYKKYVMSLLQSSPEKTVFVDIHGTSQRMFTYFETEFGCVPYSFLLSSSYRMYNEFPEICRKYHHQKKLLNVVFDARGTPIEMLNFDTIGTIQDFNKKGPIRDEPEYSTKWLEPYHVCIDYLVKCTKPWKKVTSHSSRKELGKVDFEEISTLIRRIYRVIQDNKPVLNTYIKHPGKH